MAVASVKLDDGGPAFINNCFPVRSTFGRFSNEAGGKWLEIQRDEQKRRLKTLLSSKPLTYARIKEERKKSEKTGTKLNIDLSHEEDESQNEEKTLDGFFLMKHCCVDDPSDLCSVNILNQQLTDVKEDDLAMFDNVAYVNAGENFLPFEAFQRFPCLRELELPLNGLRNLNISHTDYANLEMLDLSYNNLSQNDVLTLGLLTSLRILHLTGNNLNDLPVDMAMPYLCREKQLCVKRFACLEVLLLDDNRLKEVSIFAPLAGLPKLVHLDLSKNEIFFVPQLKSVEGKLITQDQSKSSTKGSGKRSSRQSNNTDSTKPKSRGRLSQSKLHGVIPSDGEGAEPNLIKDPNLQELLADDFNVTELNSKIDEFDLDRENSNLLALHKITEDELQKPPFSELRYLNLAHNKICNEDGLLALAAWPMLAELDIYDNPLTTETSGDPPLLKRFLQDRLGIKLNRRKPSEAVSQIDKKHGKFHPKAIKVTDQVPKVPKLTVEEKMQLFASPSLKAIDSGVIVNNLEKSVLPPITADVKDDEKRDETNKAVGETTSETIFMTQVDDWNNSESKVKERSKHKGQDMDESLEEEEPASEQENRYKGYELLLDIEDLENEPDLLPSSDVQGNVRALKLALNNLLVYRDPAADLKRVKMMVPEHRRSKVSMSTNLQTYQEKVDKVLTNLKCRSTYEEEDVGTVLKDRHLMKEKFPEAEQLLGQIQRRYNAVRVSSLKQAKTAREMARGIKQLVPARSGNH